MNDKPLTEMSDEEILEELKALRERRRQAQQRKVSERNEKSERKGPAVTEVTGAVGEALDDLFSDDAN